MIWKWAKEMFNIKEMREAIGEAVEDNIKEIVVAVREALSSPTYEKIIKKFSIELIDGELKLHLEVFDEYLAENQDVFRILIYGGILEKKNKKFVEVPPNSVLLRYFK